MISETIRDPLMPPPEQEGNADVAHEISHFPQSTPTPDLQRTESRTNAFEIVSNLPHPGGVNDTRGIAETMGPVFDYLGQDPVMSSVYTSSTIAAEAIASKGQSSSTDHRNFERFQAARPASVLEQMSASLDSLLSDPLLNSVSLSSVAPPTFEPAAAPAPPRPPPPQPAPPRPNPPPPPRVALWEVGGALSDLSSALDANYRTIAGLPYAAPPAAPAASLPHWHPAAAAAGPRSFAAAGAHERSVHPPDLAPPSEPKRGDQARRPELPGPAAPPSPAAAPGAWAKGPEPKVHESDWMIWARRIL